MVFRVFSSHTPRVLFTMAEDLTKLWGNFSLSEEESVSVEVADQDLEGLVQRGQSCLVGKLIAERVVSKEIIKSAMVRGWKPTGTIIFKVLGDNLFLVDFEHVWDKARVLEGRPWDFEGNLFSVEDFNGLIPPTQMNFDKADFWVRFFNLPLACMSKDVGFQIGSSVGLVVEVDTDEDGVGWGEFLRVKIRVDLTKSLSRGRVLKVNGSTVWVAFQYEKLPKFCFQCGIIRHGSTGCLQQRGRRSYPETATQFGAWLRVPSQNRRSNSNWGGYAGGNMGRTTNQSNSGHEDSQREKTWRSSGFHSDASSGRYVAGEPFGGRNSSCADEGQNNIALMRGGATRGGMEGTVRTRPAVGNSDENRGSPVGGSSAGTGGRRKDTVLSEEGRAVGGVESQTANVVEQNTEAWCGEKISGPPSGSQGIQTTQDLGEKQDSFLKEKDSNLKDYPMGFCKEADNGVLGEQMACDPNFQELLHGKVADGQQVMRNLGVSRSVEQSMCFEDNVLNKKKSQQVHILEPDPHLFSCDAMKGTDTVPSGQKCAKRPVLPEGEIYTVVPPVIMKSSVPIKEISTASGAVKNWKRSARVGKGTVPVVGSVSGKLGKRKMVVTNGGGPVDGIEKKGRWRAQDPSIISTDLAAAVTQPRQLQ